MKGVPKAYVALSKAKFFLSEVILNVSVGFRGQDITKACHES